MADELDDVDPGQDFEDFALGLRPVKVRRIDPDTGATLAEVTEVPAAKLIRRRSPFAVAGGEVGGDQVEFVFRADRLGFLPYARCEIETAAGEVWKVESAALEAFDALCRAQVSIKRG